MLIDEDIAQIYCSEASGKQNVEIFRSLFKQHRQKTFYTQYMEKLKSRSGIWHDIAGYYSLYIAIYNVFDAMRLTTHSKFQ